ncbi:hypothetical protein L6452_17478 [Arctium lappa]|uniref:Uncharacterized protein n=1 Tax=Arctium lappa TaxID=4217 RepID=A0ACB9C3G8_ARCLA|nr:hypothetical protein L6452_17478 [Arctium lappa]
MAILQSSNGNRFDARFPNKKTLDSISKIRGNFIEFVITVLEAALRVKYLHGTPSYQSTIFFKQPRLSGNVVHTRE